MLCPTCARGQRFSLVCLALLLSVIAERGARAETVVTNDKPKFTLTVPDGYVQMPAQGDAIYQFASAKTDADDVPEAAVLVERLGGTIDARPMKLPPDAPPGSRWTTARWGAFDLQCLSTVIVKQGHSMTARVVQIPLEGEAIQITAGVPGNNGAAADAVLATFLTRLHGPSAWADPMTTGDRAQFIAVGGGGIFLVLGVYVILFLRSRRRRRSAASHPALAARRQSQDLHRQAMWYGIGIGISLGLVIWCSATLYIGLGPAILVDPFERARLLTIGCAKLSCFLALIAYGIMRLVLGRRAAKLPPPVPWSASSPSDFENIVDDRD